MISFLFVVHRFCIDTYLPSLLYLFHFLFYISRHIIVDSIIESSVDSLPSFVALDVTLLIDITF